MAEQLTDRELQSLRNMGGLAEQAADEIADSRFQAPAEGDELTDPEIHAAVCAAVKAGRLSWLGYEKDEDGKYTVPVMSLSDYQLAHVAIAADRAARAHVQPKGTAWAVAWQEHVEERLRTWKQRTMNKSGDMLALDDFMDSESLEDLIDFVCDAWADPAVQAPAPAPEVPAGWRDAMQEALSVCDSVSMSRDRRVVREGCVLYLQTEEWCKWAEQEVAPKLRQALEAATVQAPAVAHEHTAVMQQALEVLRDFAEWAQERGGCPGLRNQACRCNVDCSIFVLAKKADAAIEVLKGLA